MYQLVIIFSLLFSVNSFGFELSSGMWKSKLESSSGAPAMLPKSVFGALEDLSPGLAEQLGSVASKLNVYAPFIDKEYCVTEEMIAGGDAKKLIFANTGNCTLTNYKELPKKITGTLSCPDLEKQDIVVNYITADKYDIKASSKSGSKMHVTANRIAKKCLANKTVQKTN